MEQSAKQLWEVYTGSWSEPDKAQRQMIFDQCLHPECEYSDANIVVVGHAGLSEYMTGFQKNVPGGRFVTTSFVEHHGRTLAHWDMVIGGQVVGQGASFAHFHADGRLRQMTGFSLPGAAQ